MNTSQIQRSYSLKFKLLSVLCLCLPTPAYSEEISTLALRQLSLDELTNLEVIVTSANKKSEKLSKTAAAIFVISKDDIKKSGVTTIPDALRMVPGIHVARIDVNKWSVTARGFSGRFANKLLVIMDGRTLYNPLFSGVYWDTQNAQLENIERIEIIRGPATAMWGANAVNGVINIITKTADQTLGGQIKASVGSEVNQGFLRYGEEISNSAKYRLYADYNNHDDSIDNSGTDTADQWNLGQLGFRLDWKKSEQDVFNIQGDYYSGESGHNQHTSPILTAPFSVIKDAKVKLSGGNVISNWQHSFSDTNQFNFKFYFDHVFKKTSTLKQQFDTFNFDLNHQFQSANWNNVNWGIGYRLIDDYIAGKANITLNPISRTTHLFSGFLQNETTLVPNHLKSIIAIRIEHNDYTGFEFQPTARLLWTPSQHHNLWVSFSRAVRTPSRSSDIRIDQKVIPGAPVRLVSIFAKESHFDSEEVYAYELGYKFIFSDGFNINISTFYNIYDELRTFEQETPFIESSPAPTHIVIPIITNNKLEGETYGVEISSTWQPFKLLTFNAAYSYTKLNLHKKHNSLDANSESKTEGETPQQQFSLRSDITLTNNWSSNLWFRYVDSLPAQSIKSYLSLDARLAWQIDNKIELSVVGQNLLASHHQEYNPEIINITPSQIERSILGKIEWHF